ncbi:MAG: amidohydrolase family protein, partial [Alphaproteobacteria bacterium]|nr:amidohydrolase family protein [Alphaproteobacteria bacterium]
ILDAKGDIVSPGFIDTHSHHERGMWESETGREMVAPISQGITTIIIGQDGMSDYPLSAFQRELEKYPVAVNIASYTGHGTIRVKAIGVPYNRPATPTELSRMESYLEIDLDGGSLGLSTGLEYDPGIYSDSDELLTLAKTLKAAGGRYISHMRSEDAKILEAIDEIIRVGREAGIPVQISHIKIALLDDWGGASSILARLDQAREEGVDITADVYPYDYWLSTLAVLLPERNFDDVAAVRHAFNHIASPDGLLLARYVADPDLVGKTVKQIADERDEDPAETYLGLLQQAYADINLEDAVEAGDIRELVLGQSMLRADVEDFIAWPNSNISTDGTSFPGHPRGYGTFPRAIRWMVRESHKLELEEMVRKMTSLSASHVGLADRGEVRVGAPADLILFSASEIADRADRENPTETSVGVTGVWVNGVRVWQDNGPTGAYPGQFLRRASQPH